MRPTDLTAATWRKSSRSGGGNGSQCVEVAVLADRAGVRDSKAVSALDGTGTGVALVCTPGSVTAFLAAAGRGEFDRY